MWVGPWFRLGLGVALVVLALDQLTKWWIIHIYELPERGRVAVTPFFDLVMLWNPGISYGLFAQETDFGRNILIAIAVGAALLLTVWMARTYSRLQAISLALIIGGAIGNAIDRAIYGAVADFVSLHAYGFTGTSSTSRMRRSSPERLPCSMTPWREAIKSTQSTPTHQRVKVSIRRGHNSWQHAAYA